MYYSSVSKDTRVLGSCESILSGGLSFRYVHMYAMHLFCAVAKGLLSRPRVTSRALHRGARRGVVSTLGASLGPDRAQWRVFWAFKVTRAGSFARNPFPLSQSQAGLSKPHNTTKFALLPLYHAVPPALQPSTLRQPRSPEQSHVKPSSLRRPRRGAHTHLKHTKYTR